MGLLNRFDIVFGGFSWFELADSRDLIKIRLNNETNSPQCTKPTKVGFIFIGPNFFTHPSTSLHSGCHTTGLHTRCPTTGLHTGCPTTGLHTGCPTTGLHTGCPTAGLHTRLIKIRLNNETNSPQCTKPTKVGYF